MTTISEQFLSDYSLQQYKQDCRALAQYNKWAEQFRQKNGWTVIPKDKKPLQVKEDSLNDKTLSISGLR